MLLFRNKLHSTSDVAETETWLKLRDRDFMKTLQDSSLKFETETRDFIIYGLYRNLFLKSRHHFSVDFFSNFWHFSDLFWLFLICKHDKQKIVEL